jgi:hypothetical protein
MVDYYYRNSSQLELQIQFEHINNKNHDQQQSTVHRELLPSVYELVHIEIVCNHDKISILIVVAINNRYSNRRREDVINVIKIDWQIATDR